MLVPAEEVGSPSAVHLFSCKDRACNAAEHRSFQDVHLSASAFCCRNVPALHILNGFCVEDSQCISKAAGGEAALHQSSQKYVSDLDSPLQSCKDSACSAADHRNFQDVQLSATSSASAAEMCLLCMKNLWLHGLAQAVMRLELLVVTEARAAMQTPMAASCRVNRSHPPRSLPPPQP